MNIVVTGGLGYIGQHVVKILEERGHNVMSVDCGWYQTPKSYMSANIGTTLIPENIELEETFHGFELDVIIHLAGVVGEPASLQHPELTFETNYSVTKSLMNACGLTGTKFIFASSCSVYGNQEGLLTEESPYIPLGLYALTKYLNEIEIIKELDDYTILRFGTVYGSSPRQRFDLVINKFTALAATGEPLQVYGGKQERPFTNVKDIARAIVHAVENDLQGVYNVADTNFNMKQAAEQIAELLDATVEIVETKEDNRSYEVSSQKLLDTGFRFEACFEDEIQKLADWVKTPGNDWRDTEWYNT